MTKSFKSALLHNIVAFAQKPIALSAAFTNANNTPPVSISRNETTCCWAPVTILCRVPLHPAGRAPKPPRLGGSATMLNSPPPLPVDGLQQQGMMRMPASHPLTQASAQADSWGRHSGVSASAVTSRGQATRRRHRRCPPRPAAPGTPPASPAAAPQPLAAVHPAPAQWKMSDVLQCCMK